MAKPAFGVTVKFVVAPWFTACAVPGESVPPAPALGVTVYCVSAKVAVTLLAALIVRLHCPAPEQSPDQPVKVAFAPGVATSVTPAPEATFALQVAPQSIVPGGELATVPVPLPAFETESPNVPG